jgi:hypothetical protein
LEIKLLQKRNARLSYKPKSTYFREKLREAKSNQIGATVIIIIAALLFGLYFFLPEYTRQCVGLVAPVTGLIIGVVGALELSYHSKEYNEYHALINELDTRKTPISG